MRPVMFGILALLALLSTACSEELVPRTQLMAVIDAEDSLRVDIRRLRVRVSGRAAGDPAWGEPSFDQEYAQLEWPFRVGIAPEANDVRRRVLIEAVAVSQTGEELMVLRAVTGFLESRTLAVPMLFEGLCLRRSCLEETETCRAGNCESAELDPNKLMDIDKFDSRVRPFDAGRWNDASSLPLEAGSRPELDAAPALDAASASDDAAALVDATQSQEAALSPGDASDAAALRPTLCGTTAASASPGSDCPGIVTCGNAEAPCDLAVQTCCTFAFTDLGGECTAATSCGLNARTACDGPEDCRGADLCCFEGGGASCRASCDLINTMCHIDSDCTQGVCRAGSVGGPFWVYWGFCRVP